MKHDEGHDKSLDLWDVLGRSPKKNVLPPWHGAIERSRVLRSPPTGNFSVGFMEI